MLTTGESQEQVDCQTIAMADVGCKNFNVFGLGVHVSRHLGVWARSRSRGPVEIKNKKAAPNGTALIQRARVRLFIAMRFLRSSQR